MLRSIYLKTIRDHRMAIAAWGFGLGTLMALVMLVARDQFSAPEAAASLLQLATSFSWLAEPVEITTPSGFATWRIGTFVPLLTAIWALLSASRTIRGEEQRASLDVLLSTPRSRLRLASEKQLGLFTSLLLIGLFFALPVVLAGSLVQAGFTVWDALLTGVNISLFGAVFAALSLLLSQFTQESGPAAGMTGAILAAAFVLDSLGRTVPQLEAVRWISPLHYYGLSKPLIPSYGANPGAMLALAIMTAALGMTATLLFVRRDIGAAIAISHPFRRRTFDDQDGERRSKEARIPVDHWSLRSLYSRSLAMVLGQGFWWAVVIALYGALMTVVAKQIKESVTTLLQSSGFFSEIAGTLGGGDIATDASFLNIAAFSLLPLLLVSFAAMQAGKWASDEEDGRLELVLATPHPRPLVMLARYAALTTAIAAIVVVVFVVVSLAAAVSGLEVPLHRVLAATVAMAPPAFLVAAIGFLLSGWLRAAAVTGLLMLFLVVSFFLSFLGPVLHWPAGIIQLSLFEQYGTPLVSGLNGSSIVLLLASTAIALTAATVRFARKDIRY